RVVWLSIVGALLALGLIALALHKPDSAVVVSPQPAASQEATTTKPTEAAPSGSSAPSVDLQALPVESATAREPPVAATARGPGFGQKALPPAVNTAVTASPSAKPTKAAPRKWRQDPGF
ncbi:MAG TPA: hypothetical protein VIK01_16280, partial [Polyangiaceae bacterium]